MQRARPTVNSTLPDWLPYVENSSLGIRTTDVFQSYIVETSRGSLAARSMLTPYELALLHAVAKDWYTGEGEIIDAGPLLGLSTYALARGVAANEQAGQKSRRIYSFDLFLDFDMGWHVEGCGSGTGSVFDKFLEINRDHLDFMSVSPGDLLRMRWNGKPIEVLFIDVAKTWDLNDWVLRNWFPVLVPDRSVVLQQDYVYFHQYWISLTMAWLREYFERCEEVFGATVAFLNRAPIPAEKLNTNLSDLPLRHKAQLLQQAIEDSSPSAREVLKCGLAYCMLEHGELNEARSILDKVRAVAGYEPHSDFSPIARSNRKLVLQILERRL
jgi:hypothetical protein